MPYMNEQCMHDSIKLYVKIKIIKNASKNIDINTVSCHVSIILLVFVCKAYENENLWGENLRNISMHTKESVNIIQMNFSCSF